ncbi:uncharacterized protein LOC113349544 [Papaver somniferum]|uniref:uncharacterized protein LOC113349544 n=1 Tax=Papaver somniferum TaxID=3469 RepID=UPI000E6F9DAA|nr:uncharacterized protein LOC113349544 [Papaver somniferum]
MRFQLFIIFMVMSFIVAAGSVDHNTSWHNGESNQNSPTWREEKELIVPFPSFTRGPHEIPDEVHHGLSTRDWHCDSFMRHSSWMWSLVLLLSHSRCFGRRRSTTATVTAAATVTGAATTRVTTTASSATTRASWRSSGRHTWWRFGS